MNTRTLETLAAKYDMDPADRALLRSMSDASVIPTRPTLDLSRLEAPSAAGAPEAPPIEPPDPATGGGARYEDRGPIGMGGMGEVRRVFDRALGRTMAMKIIRADRLDDPLTRSRFVEEARANAQLQHPGIVPVHELGWLPDERLYFTMQEVRGRTMASVIASVHAASTYGWAEAGGWTFRRLISAFQAVCRTVAYAHSRGIIHRDLKPNNVMLGEFGEAIVLDWGLAKAHGQRDVAVSTEAAVVMERAMDTREGSINGTPAFMSPEAARGTHAASDPSSDTYSLGAILYTILSNRDPYEGPSARDVLDQVLRAPPARPGRSDGPVAPRELVDLCLWAMARDPADRPATASELAEGITRWLDGAQARERALATVAAADLQLEEAEALRSEADRLAEQAKEQLAGVASWQPEELKAPGWATADRAHQLRLEADLKELEYQQSLQHALNQSPDLDEAHLRLAAIHLQRHQQAEARRDLGEAAQRLALVRQHHRGRHAAYLRGDGALTLVTDPAGAEVLLYRYETRNRRLVPTFVRSLGHTPLSKISLPKGSYLAAVRAPDRPEVRYPFQIGRLDHWDGIPPGASEPHPIVLPATLSPDEIYVPAGWFLAGGDPSAYGGLERRRLWADAVIVDRFPITLDRYLAFLRDLQRHDQLELLDRCLPKAGGTGAPAGVRVVEGDIERITDEAGWWLPDWPVFNVDWWCALAYATWRTQQTGQPWRLPGELEWEKAARGVDGRFYPWGDHLDPSWCQITDSHRDIRTPAPVDSHPVDASPYGVRGMGGNVADWCADEYLQDGPACPDDRVPREPRLGDVHAPVLRVVRGGSWDYLSARRARSSGRDRRVASFRFSLFGFRLARSCPWAVPQASRLR